MQEKKKIFALDIGTRSVVGIILEENNHQFYVSDMLIKEHKERAMLDGQIHDIVSVSKVIKEVKEELEQKHGPLKSVCVAAAGRALKTEKAQASLSIKGKPMMTKEDILHLELSAVQKAQALAAEKYSLEKSRYYYCVGYSVFQYRLDGEEIGNLIDQRGDEASVEIISTFLPRMVVESLINALKRADLEMEALTLEPIAAINVLIPASIRRLNVALVDIGAGTSDIAITNMGTVIAYGMVPIAGDEITEAISDQFLLDFPLAEKAKRDLFRNDHIVIQDILGFETKIKKDEVTSQISYAIKHLATSISDEIKLLNNHSSPKAVMLVGGGSLTTDLAKEISISLNLPENRVAIRGADAIHSLTISENIPMGPEFVTPIGIAIAAKQTPVHYLTVYVNDLPVRLFEVKKLTIGDCILASGIKLSSLHGKPGTAVMISLNGQQITVPGEHGQPPEIVLNDEIASLNDHVSNGDQINAIRGLDGKPAQVKIKDFIDEIPSKKVHINDRIVNVSMVIKKNGRYASEDEMLEDRDSIELSFPSTLEELFKTLQMNDELLGFKPFRLRINGTDTFFPSFTNKILVNNREVKASHSFHHNDRIRIVKQNPLSVKKFASLKNIELYNHMNVFFNGDIVTVKKTLTEITRGGQSLAEDDILQMGDEIEITFKAVEPFIFQDIFRHVEINMPKDSKGKFRLLKNKNNTTFYDTIVEGDQLEIIWSIHV